MTVTPACGGVLTFADTAGPAPPGACSATQTVTIANSGAGPLDIISISITGAGFYFTDMTQAMAGFTIPAFSNQALDLMFCPDLDNGALYTGTLAIFHLATQPASPCTFSLSGQEMRNIILTTAPYANGDLWTFPQTAAGLCSAAEVLTITNDASSQGDAALSGTISAGFTATFASGTALPPGASTTLSVQFCPTVNNNLLQTGVLNIFGAGPDTPSGDATVTINVEGQEDPLLP